MRINYYVDLVNKIYSNIRVSTINYRVGTVLLELVMGDKAPGLRGQLF